MQVSAVNGSQNMRVTGFDVANAARASQPEKTTEKVFQQGLAAPMPSAEDVTDTANRLGL